MGKSFLGEEVQKTKSPPIPRPEGVLIWSEKQQFLLTFGSTVDSIGEWAEWRLQTGWRICAMLVDNTVPCCASDFQRTNRGDKLHTSKRKNYHIEDFHLGNDVSADMSRNRH